METLLIAIVLISLGLAAVMSVIAWKLLREGRERAAARVAALESLAMSDGHASRGETPLEDAMHDDDVVDFDIRAEERDELEDDWDFPIREDVAPTLVATRDHAARPPRRPHRPEKVVSMPHHHRPAAIPDDMFASSAAEPSRQSWQGLSAVLTAAVVFVVGAGVVYAVRSTELLSATSQRLSTPDPASIAPIELLSLRHQTDPTGAFTVTGLVGNPADGTSLTNIVAVVYLFDSQGRYFAGGRATLELGNLRPGDQSPFVVTVPDAGLVDRYRVGFRFQDGGVVAHVDQRGQPLRGTSGDAVNGVERTGSRQPAGPHRVEG